MAPSFQTIAAQHPPTPPREKSDDHCIDEAVRFLDDSLNLEDPEPVKTSHDAEPNTPPPSSPLDRASSRHKSTKRIRFLPEPIPRPASQDIALKALPPSRERKCKKSILKPYTPSPSCENRADPFSSPLAGQNANTLPRMLESIVQQLAGQDMISRYEAYQTLSACLKAYDQTPDPALLEAKIPILQDFLRRDLTTTASDGTSPVHRLPLLALKTTQALLFSTPSSRMFSQEFLAFLIDQATASLNATTLSKELVLNYMHLLTQQKLYIKAMTRNRSQKLYISLSTIHGRVTGNNVYRLRLMIYQRFIRHCPQTAVENLHHWLEHMFHGMLSENTDIRARSIEASITAGTQIVEIKQLAKAVVTIIHQDIGDDRKYYDHFVSRLEELSKQPDHREHVPQIWGAVMLLMQANEKLIQTWLTSPRWLRLLELCFNASDAGLNLHAWLAWNKTIFAAKSLSSGPVMRRLRAPIVGHLQRKVGGKITEAAFSTYAGLLYYAFAPTTTAQHQEECWKMLIQEVVPKIVQHNPSETGRLCTMISSLLSRHNVTPWDAARALRTSEEPFRLDEIPRLDAQWIRSNIDKIGEVVKVLMTTASQDDQHKLWSSLMSAISEASSKEIKASLDTRKATAVITSIFCSLGSGGQRWQQSSKSLTSLATAIIAAIGPEQACDAILMKSASGSFEVMSTPSRNALKPIGQLVAPVVAIMHMFGSLDGRIEIDLPLRVAFQDILRPCWQTRPTRRGKVQFLRMCAAALPLEKAQSGQSKVQAQLWQSIIELASDTLHESSLDATGATTSPSGSDVKDLVYILVLGFRFSDAKSLRLGRELFTAIRQFVKSQAGDAGVLLQVLTPLIHALDFEGDACCVTAALQYTGCILEEELVLPSPRVLEQARKALWGAQETTHEGIGPKWLMEFYTLIDDVLVKSYASMETLPGLAVQDLLRTLTGYLEAPKSSQRTGISGPELFLWHTSAGVAAFLKDADAKLIIHQDRGVDNRPELRKLWLSLLGTAARLSLHSNAVLRVMEETLCAGFQSRSKAIVNLTVAAWNNTYGAQDTLEYPEQLAKTLERLKNLVEIDLPGFKTPVQQDDANVDDQSMFLWLASTSDSQVVEEPPKSSIPASVTPRKAQQHPSVLRRSAQPTPVEKTAKETSLAPSTPPARLRHNDSQVQFVAVESSPIEAPTYDSQLLTDRQKEVKARQQVDAAIFSDIRSSSPVAEMQQADVSATIRVEDVEMTEEPVARVVEHLTAQEDVGLQTAQQDLVPNVVEVEKDVQVDTDTTTTDREREDESPQPEVELDDDVQRPDKDIPLEQAQQAQLDDDMDMYATFPPTNTDFAPSQTEEAPELNEDEVVADTVLEEPVEDDAAGDDLPSTEVVDQMDIDKTVNETQLLDITTADAEPEEAAEELIPAYDLEIASDPTEEVEEPEIIKAVESTAEPAIPEQSQFIEASVSQGHRVPMTPYVLVYSAPQDMPDAVPSLKRCRPSGDDDDSDNDDDLIVVKQKKPDSPSLMTLLKEAKAFSSQKSPRASFTSASPGCSSPRKRPASQVQDDEQPSQLIERAAKRRRSGRPSRQSQNQSQSQDQEQLSQSQSQQSQTSPEASQSFSQSSKRRSGRLSGIAPSSPEASQSFSQSSARRSSRRSRGDASNHLLPGITTPRQNRRSRKLVQSTAVDVTPSRRSYKAEDDNQDEDELSQDVVPDTAIPGTPASGRRRRGSKLGETPVPRASVDVDVDVEDTVMQSEESELGITARPSWAAEQEDETTTNVTELPFERRVITKTSVSPTKAPTAPSMPSTPFGAQGARQAEQPTPMTSTSLARSFINSALGLWEQAKLLTLGPAQRAEREELEDVMHEINREITRATRRGGD